MENSLELLYDTPNGKIHAFRYSFHLGAQLTAELIVGKEDILNA